ncbi:MAG: UvrABC system protein C [Myxococcales bacterium]
MSPVSLAPFDLEERLRTLPRAPGVYLMKDRAGTIIYVGKAKSLANRIRSYFGATSDTRFFVGLLDRVLGDIEIVITANEKEALLLENELIKKHKPRFNVELKDDKNFLSIRIDRRTPYPRLEVVRRRKSDGAWYFGPYHSASAIRKTLRIINRHFYLRTCPDSVMRNRSRPCLEYQIHRCPGPCVLPVDPSAYRESVEEVAMFLEGRAEQLVAGLEGKMASAAAALDFELAAHFRDQIRAIQQSLMKQDIDLGRDRDMDAFALYREGALCTVQLVQVRLGFVSGSRAFSLGRHELPDDEVLSSFVQQFYDRAVDLPDEVLLPVELEGAEALEAWLGERKGTRVAVLRPQRGAKVRILEMAARNAAQSFTEKQRTEAESLVTLANLQRRLSLRNLPSRIECYDISNIQGSEAVASMVVFTDGEPDKAAYRRFRMKSPAEPNDFLMMHETITRRFKKGAETGDLPQLVVIDGGKGQLNAALQALTELDVVDVDIVGLAKSRIEESGGTLSDAPTHSPERVFLPGQKNPVVLRQSSSELYLLARIRDEAHRFAITYHKLLRDKRTLKSPLDDVPGIGDARKRALLQHFGSLKRLRAATPEQMAEVPGIGPELAAAIARALTVGG